MTCYKSDHIHIEKSMYLYSIDPYLYLCIVYIFELPKDLICVVFRKVSLQQERLQLSARAMLY